MTNLYTEIKKMTNIDFNSLDEILLKLGFILVKYESSDWGYISKTFRNAEKAEVVAVWYWSNSKTSLRLPDGSTFRF